MWLALFVGAYSAADTTEKTGLRARITMFLMSFAFGLLSYADAAEKAGRSEVYAALICAAFAYRIFLIISAIILDRDFLRKAFLAKLGVKS